MIRTAMRLSTLAALTNGGSAPWPTLVGPHVYDSRREAFHDLREDEWRACAVLRTDDDTRRFQGRATRERMIELRIEFFVITLMKDEAGEPVEHPPATDAELEATLDLLEWQMEAALLGHGPWALWWRGLWPDLQAFESRPMFTAPEEGRVRLAARELTLRIANAGDCLPGAVREGDPLPPPALPASLAAVIERIVAGEESAGPNPLQAAAQALKTVIEAGGLPIGHVYPALTRVLMREHVPGTPEGETPADRHRAPLLGDWVDDEPAPPPAPDWIMEFGLWNDAGQWADGAEWNDGA